MEEAAGLLISLLKAQPENATLHEIWGDVISQTQHGTLDLARRHYFDAGKLFLKESKPKKALKAFNRAAIQGGTEAATLLCAVWLWKGQTARIMGLYKDAKISFETSMKIANAPMLLHDPLCVEAAMAASKGIAEVNRLINSAT